MEKIKKLSEQLIPKIAAGEVVDRPASIVKELLDNSIDAGATEIEIIIKKAGKELIEVVDNGEGMCVEDLLKCVDNHTTSKIYTEEDLNNIKTYGFRGEALSSIGSVSKLNITTREKNKLEGNNIEVIGGIKSNINKKSSKEGTNIKVEDLFYNIPARKKFLKTDQTEFQHILELVEKYAIINTNVSFKVTHNNKLQLQVKRTNDLKTRLLDIYGNSVQKSILKIENKKEHLTITGYIGTPANTSYNSNSSNIFVNNRYIENKKIMSVIKSSYGKLIENRSFPFYILIIEVDPVLVNINIHPQKKEVTFWNDMEVLESIKETIENTLQTGVINYDTNYYGKNIQKANKNTFNSLKDETVTWNIKGITEKEDYEEIFQINKTYICAKTKKGIVLVDQHAAHESILYKQYLNKYLNKETNLTLEINEIFDTSISNKNFLLENYEDLHRLGFEIEDFGGTSIKVNKIPELFKSYNTKKLVEELIQNIKEHKLKNIDEKSKQTIEFLSCRGAIKAGEILTQEEMKNLLKKLEEDNDYLTCPHGRPTKRFISIKDLEKMFKRI